MKKQFFLIVSGLFFLAAFSSCIWHDDDTSISIFDSEDEYRMTASYEKRKTRMVQRFLNRCLDESSNTSFINARIDGEIALDDRSTFYIRMFPGELNIKFDKTENPDESYHKMKEICEDIKDLLAENERMDR